MSDAATGTGHRTGTTADAREVARFAAIAAEWWDESGKFKPLHLLQPPRLAFLKEHLCRHFDRDPDATAPLAGLRILDAGCGGGLVSEPLARLGASVVGIDAADESIGVARAHAEMTGLTIDYRQALPEDLADGGETFDAVVALEIVEHVADLDAFLGALAALTRPGGAVALSTLNRTLKSLALAKVGAEYVLRWVPAGTHDWRKFVKPSELARGLRRHGVTLETFAGLAYNPLADRWGLSRDLSVNYLTFGEKQ